MKAEKPKYVVTEQHKFIYINLQIKLPRAITQFVFIGYGLWTKEPFHIFKLLEVHNPLQVWDESNNKHFRNYQESSEACRRRRLWDIM